MAGCTNKDCFIEPKKNGTDGVCRCLEPLGKCESHNLAKRIRLMEKTLRAQQRMMTAYQEKDFRRVPKWVFDTLDQAKDGGLI